MKNKKNQFFKAKLFSRFLTKSANNFLFKPTIIMLVFLFVFQPMASVFAQEAQEVNVIVPESPVIGEIGQIPAISNVEPTQTISPITELSPSEIPLVLSPEPQAPTIESVPIDSPLEQNTEQNVAEKEPVAAQALNQNEENKQPSSSLQLTQKLPEIDKNTGALTYNYSIAVPPGRNGFQPEIGLSYNSNSNEQNSIAGYGWTINIPYIKRLNKAGSDKLYTSGAASYFYSSLDGELTSAGGVLYVPKIENGNFNKYTFENNQWIVVFKNGTQYKFGYNDNSKQNDPANPDNVYKWMLQEIRDTNDNFISYEYFKDRGQIYPLSIKYTGNGSTDGIFEADFQRIDRTDNFANYSTGFSVKSNYLIGEITANINNDWTNKYVLNYEKSQDANKSLLKSITTSGKNSSGNIVSLAPSNFSYQNSTAGFTPSNTSWNIPSPPEGDWNLLTRSPQFADLNGDGLQDLVIVAHIPIVIGTYHGSRLQDYQYLNTGSGWLQTTAWNFPGVPDGESLWQWPTIPPMFTDLNGDGLTDLVLVASHYNYGNIYKDYQYLNTGNGWAPNFTWQLPTLPEGEWNFISMPPQFVDLNGDGLPDISALTSLTFY